jgi:hypothetical protein
MILFLANQSLLQRTVRENSNASGLSLSASGGGQGYSKLP